jgi:hypothetical protein
LDASEADGRRIGSQSDQGRVRAACGAVFAPKTKKENCLPSKGLAVLLDRAKPIVV